jgi:hypothetical protein
MLLHLDDERRLSLAVDEKRIVNAGEVPLFLVGSKIEMNIYDRPDDLGDDSCVF